MFSLKTDKFEKVLQDRKQDGIFLCDFNNNICEGIIYMEEDTSILFKNVKGVDFSLDYTISLGGNPRFLIDVSHETGKCGKLRFFMTGVDVIQKELKIPQSEKGELHFSTNEEMIQYSGTMYMKFKDDCFYDKKIIRYA